MDNPAHSLGYLDLAQDVKEPRKIVSYYVRDWEDSDQFAPLKRTTRPRSNAILPPVRDHREAGLLLKQSSHQNPGQIPSNSTGGNDDNAAYNREAFAYQQSSRNGSSYGANSVPPTAPVPEVPLNAPTGPKAMRQGLPNTSTLHLHARGFIPVERSPVMGSPATGPRAPFVESPAETRPASRGSSRTPPREVEDRHLEGPENSYFSSVMHNDQSARPSVSDRGYPPKAPFIPKALPFVTPGLNIAVPQVDPSLVREHRVNPGNLHRSIQTAENPLTQTTEAYRSVVDTATGHNTRTGISPDLPHTFQGFPPSTIDSASTSARTKSTGSGYVTTDTSVHSSSGRDDFEKTPTTLRRPLAAIEEDIEEQNETAEASRSFDQISVVSGGSTEYTPQQRNDVVNRFTKAMLRRLTIRSSYLAPSDSSRQHLIPHLRIALKAFTEAVVIDRFSSHPQKALRMIRRWRQDIASKVQSEILKPQEELQRNPAPITPVETGHQISFLEKVRHWDTDVHVPYLQATYPFPALSPQDSPAGSVNSAPSLPAVSDYSPSTDGTLSENDTSIEVYGAGVNPDEVLEYFTTQSAFDKLLQQSERLFDRYHSHKNDFIRHRTSLALRRHFPDIEHDKPQFQAIFQIDCDLQHFLENNYESTTRQDLKKVLVVTGDKDRAWACSVSEYFTWCWPGNSTKLLSAICQRLGESRGHANAQALDNSSCSVILDPTLRIFNTCGPQDFIISIGQQLSWLTAAIQQRRDSLDCAYVGFLQRNIADLNDTPIFSIDAKVEAIQVEDGPSCWHEVVGHTVIVTGFPIPDRQARDIGLEVEVALMFALARTPQPVTFKGGFVFKGRHHAIIPVGESGQSIQWHLINSYPKKIDWAYIDQACPTRLRNHKNKAAFWSARAFLGWSPCITDTLGAEEYQFNSIQYSNAGKRSRGLYIDKVTFGFTQWAQLTMDVGLGKRDGFRNPNYNDLDDYETLLDDAKRTRIILHDTTHRRAFQTSAEDLILHLIQHRRAIPGVLGTGPSGNSKAENICFASSDRAVLSTREAMMKNAGKILSHRRQFSNSELRPHRFMDEVKALYSTIDGLWAHDHAAGDSTMGLSLRNHHTAIGWEYMDVLKNRKHMIPKSVALRKTCGKWAEFARDIQAIVFFASNFGDILLPTAPNYLCPDFRTVPKGECYLAVRTATLRDLFEEQGSLEDQKQLTPSGLSLCGSQHIFRSCYPQKHRSSKSCSCQRILRLTSPSTIGKQHTSIPLSNDGAVIIGSLSNTIFQKLLNKNLQYGQAPKLRSQTFVSRSSQPTLRHPGSDVDPWEGAPSPTLSRFVPDVNAADSTGHTDVTDGLSQLHAPSSRESVEPSTSGTGTSSSRSVATSSKSYNTGKTTVSSGSSATPLSKWNNIVATNIVSERPAEHPQSLEELRGRWNRSHNTTSYELAIGNIGTKDFDPRMPVSPSLRKTERHEQSDVAFQRDVQMHGVSPQIYKERSLKRQPGFSR